MDTSKQEETILKNPRYRCCCDSLNVKKGTWILTTSSIIALLMGLFVYFSAPKLKLSTDPQIAVLVELYLIFALIYLIVLVCAVVGLLTRKPALLIPLIVACVVVLIADIIAMIVLPILAFASISDEVENSKKPVSAKASAAFKAFGLFVGPLIGALVTLWFLHIFYRCYQFLEKLGRVRRMSTTLSQVLKT